MKTIFLQRRYSLDSGLPAGLAEAIDAKYANVLRMRLAPCPDGVARLQRRSAQQRLQWFVTRDLRSFDSASAEMAHLGVHAVPEVLNLRHFAPDVREVWRGIMAQSSDRNSGELQILLRWIESTLYPPLGHVISSTMSNISLLLLRLSAESGDNVSSIIAHSGSIEAFLLRTNYSVVLASVKRDGMLRPGEFVKITFERESFDFSLRSLTWTLSTDSLEQLT